MGEALTAEELDGEVLPQIGRQYAAMTRLWANLWSEFVSFLDYDVEGHGSLS